MIGFIMIKRMISAPLLACLLIFVLVGSGFANQIKYTDVPASHWAYPSIQALAEAGILYGYRDGSFKPELKVTREQFAVAIVRALKIPLDEKAPQIFSDITPKHRSFLYIDAAKSFIPTPPGPQGYFNFNPDQVIAREEVAEAVTLALNLKEIKIPDEKSLSQSFKDFQNISPAYRTSAALTLYYGILSGDPGGNFNGKAGLSRAELSVVLNNILKKKSAVDEALKPPHKPWTIEFIDFQRPDIDMVRDFPGYNKTQRFYGTVTSKVYGFDNSHLVVTHKSNKETGNQISVEIKTVHFYVYEKDLDLFSRGDALSLDYDRNNNVISYNLGSL